ncbi:adenylate kinase [Nowakowskiella sp. JEL0407]|nr:adenylate kinase [Nowakowskiella sp. JEL0407]
MDPLTGTLYPTSQIEFSKSKPFAVDLGEPPEQQHLLNGSQDDTDDKESQLDDTETDEINNEENTDLDSQPPVKPNPTHIESTLSPSPPHTWPIIPPETLSRLIKRYPMDTFTHTQNLLKHWDENIQPELGGFIQKYFLGGVENVDAGRSPDEVYKDVETRCEGFAARVVLPKRVEGPGETGKELTDAEYITWFTSAELEPGEPVREIGQWGKFCPVSFFETKTLHESGYSNVASYKGYLYFMKTHTHLLKFLTNPDTYISQSQPYLPNLQICVLGGPFSGKSTQAKILAEVYCLEYVNVDDLVVNLGMDSDGGNGDCEVGYGGVWEKVNYEEKYVKEKDWGTGKPLTTELLLEIIKSKISPHDPSIPIPDSKKTKKRGWVLDGFPRTLEQAHALINAGLIPQHVVILQNDINNEIVRPRSFTYHVSPHGTPLPPSTTSSHSQSNSKHHTNTHEIYQYPYFDNLYNGYKEESTQIVTFYQDQIESPANIINVGADMSAATVVSVVRNSFDPFVMKASVVKSIEVPPQPEWGLTKNYCPVVLKRENILQRGNKSVLAKYMARDSFIMEPHNFVNVNQGCIPPPPRIIFLGIPGSGKTSAIQTLKKFDIPHIEFEQFLTTFANKQSPEVKQELQEMITDGSGLISPQLIIDILKYLFLHEPYKTKGFMLENFPKTKLQIETMIKHDLLIDAFIVLQTDPETATKRVLSQLRKKSKQEVSERARVALKRAGGVVGDEGGVLEDDEVFEMFLDR